MNKKETGQMCIFLGYAAGVGKTYAMLEAAHDLKKSGVDVVAGYIEPHERAETKSKEEGLEKIPPLLVDYKGIKLREVDLNGILKRNPEVVLIDELAHTNAPGMRHQKRYEDIEEILNAGIDVYTTVNIQHLESLNDIVGKISGIHVKERIPDFIFDRATQIKLIDIEPDVLIKRLKDGKIYKSTQAERALHNFFAKEKLIALREITLRRTADKVNREAVKEQQAAPGYEKRETYQGEHILVCISPAPSCEKVIRSASRLAYAFQGKFTALYVETPSLQNADERVKKKRDENIRMARLLGAKIVTVFGEDVAFQIAEYARISGVSKIVIGRTSHRYVFGQRKRNLTDQIDSYTEDVDIYIIPDRQSSKMKWHEEFKKKQFFDSQKVEGCYAEVTKGILALVLSTAVGLGMQYLGFLNADIIMVYLLGVLLLSLYTRRWFIPAAVSLISVLFFDFLFVEPLYSLEIYKKGYGATFLFMLIFSLSISTIISNARRQARESAKMVYRTELLLDNSRRMRRADNIKDILKELSGQVLKLMNLPVVFFLNKDGKAAGPWAFPKEGESQEALRSMIDSQERAVADWVIANKKRAGCCTHTLPGAKAMYLPIKTSDEIYGVMGIILEEKRQIPSFEYGLLTAMLNEAALVFARIYLVSGRREKNGEKEETNKEE